MKGKFGPTVEEVFSGLSSSKSQSLQIYYDWKEQKLLLWRDLYSQ